MITAEREKGLTQVFWLIKDVPGWFSHCQKAGYDKNELLFLENMAEINHSTEDKLGVWNREVNSSFGPEIHFEEDADKKISMLSGMIERAWSLMRRLREVDTSYLERDLVYKLINIKGLEKLRKRLRANQCHRPSEHKDGITDDQIVRAREYPLENIVEVGKQGRILCPWHTDNRPSGLVKNGFFFCFACGEWADSLKWVMKTEGLSFVDAVRKLS